MKTYCYNGFLGYCGYCGELTQAPKQIFRMLKTPHFEWQVFGAFKISVIKALFMCLLNLSYVFII